MADTQQRKLAAIMFTDIVGFGALTQRNEALALELRQEHHRLLRAAFASHEGQEANMTGDGFLTLFASAVAAVRCAVESQRTLTERNAVAPPERQLQIRIGIHVGEVVSRENDVSGDAVNVAARLEPLAEPGGICVSQAVRDQVRQRIDEPVVSLGREALKHIREAVEIYRIALPWEKPRRPFVERLSFRLRHQQALSPALVSLATLVGLAAFATTGFALWKYARDQRISGAPPSLTTPLSGPRTLDPHWIAVLPCENHCPDPAKDQYFVDGMTVELTDRLMKIEALTVIGPESAQKYGGQGLPKIGRDLNVGTVLLPSVRRAANTLRINVRLLGVQSQRELWSEQYDEEYTSPRVAFRIQSDVAQKVARALQVEVMSAERQLIEKVSTNHLSAYDLYLQGRAHLYKATDEEMRAAVTAFKGALDIDPQYARAYAGIAEAAADMYLTLAPPAEMDQWRARASSAARRALTLDRKLAEAHQAMAAIYWKTELNWDALMKECRQALELNPNLDQPHVFRSVAFFHLGLLDRAKTEIDIALKRNPTSERTRIDGLLSLGFIALYRGRYAEAAQLTIEWERRRGVPNWKEPLALFYQGKHAQSEELLEKAIRTGAAPMLARNGAVLASVLAALHQTERAEKQIAAVRRSSPLDHHVCYSLGAAYAQLSKRDEALIWLKKAAASGQPCYPWFARDPLLDPLRKDLRFIRFLEDVKKLTDDARKRYPL